MEISWRLKILFIFIFECYSPVNTLSVTHLDVPEIVDYRDHVTLSCSYILSGHKLNSVKWYKDEQEFFRYSPMMHPFFMTFPVNGIVIANDNFFCNEITCSIDLRQLTRKSSGTYRCEVSGDAPEFKLTTKASNMTVAALPHRDPTISVLNRTYRLDELVVANCSSDWSSPPAVLSWYINNEKALPEWLQIQRETTTHIEEFTLRLSTLELRFYLNNQIIMSSQGIIYLKCVADIERFPILRRESIQSAFVVYDDDVNNQKLINQRRSGQNKHLMTTETISILIIIGFLCNYLSVISTIETMNSRRAVGPR